MELSPKREVSTANKNMLRKELDSPGPLRVTRAFQ